MLHIFYFGCMCMCGIDSKSCRDRRAIDGVDIDGCRGGDQSYCSKMVFPHSPPGRFRIAPISSTPRMEFNSKKVKLLARDTAPRLEIFFRAQAPPNILHHSYASSHGVVCEYWLAGCAGIPTGEDSPKFESKILQEFSATAKGPFANIEGE